MNAARRLIVALVAIAISIATSLLVMINGWGLEPKSWFWILGIGLLGQMLAQVFILIANHDSK
jgi:hypothetical protein